jgi:hypothetical protein
MGFTQCEIYDISVVESKDVILRFYERLCEESVQGSEINVMRSELVNSAQVVRDFVVKNEKVFGEDEGKGKVIENVGVFVDDLLCEAICRSCV